MTSKYGGIPVDQPGSKYGGLPVEDGDSFLDNTLDVLGEAAAGANRTMLYIPDTILKAANMIPGINVPTISEGVEMVTGYKPGEGGYMDEGLAKQAVEAAGEVFIPGAMASKVVQGRNLASAPGAVSEFLGFGSAAPVTGAVADATEQVRHRLPAGERPKRLPAPPEEKFIQLHGKPDRTLSLRRNSGDVAAAGYKMGPDGSPVKDAAQQRALKAGIDEGIVAQVASGSPADKQRMGQALDILEQGRKNKTFADFNHPRLALGDTLMDRYTFVRDVNKRAGEKLKVAKDRMKTTPADVGVLTEINDGPARNFLSSLADSGVTVDREGQIFFGRSEFRNNKEAQDIIAGMVEMMRSPDDFRTAYDLHVLKSTIDDMVNYGQSVKGLKGKAINYMKSLRHDVGQILNKAYPDYGEANQIYSETIEVLNEIDDLVGKKNDISDKALARIARQSLSNAQRSERVGDMLLNVDEVAKRHGAEFGDDVQRQTSFVQSLEKMFNVSPPASIKGEFDKSLRNVEDTLRATQGDSSSAIGLATKGLKKAFGKTEAQRQQELLDALRGLMDDGSGQVVPPLRR